MGAYGYKYIINWSFQVILIIARVLLIDLFKLQRDLLENNFIKVFPIILECFSGIRYASA